MSTHIFSNRLEWRYQLFVSGGSYVEHSVGPSPCPMFDLLHSTQVCIRHFVLFVYLSSVLRLAWEHFAHIKTLSLSVKVCKIYAYARDLISLNKERSCHTRCFTLLCLFYNLIPNRVALIGNQRDWELIMTRIPKEKSGFWASILFDNAQRLIKKNEMKTLRTWSI